jgi:4-aminobutyrate aminotransferase-like enzyme/Ser/Thr protein kinase RdoA (MazF antagonist)
MSTKIDINGVKQLALIWIRDLFGIRGKLSKLSGYEDLNFLVSSDHGEKYVLKLSTSVYASEDIKSQNQILNFLQQHSENPRSFPSVITGLDGQTIYQVTAGEQSYFLRLLTYLHGELMENVTITDSLLYDLGGFLGALDQCLQPLELPALRLKSSPWDLQNALDCMKYLADISDAHYRRLVSYFMQQFEYQVLPKYHGLPKGTIHGDANDHNLLVSEQKISGIIDFGDASYSYLINELAVAVTYVMLTADDLLDPVSKVCKGYHLQRSLSGAEIELLYYLVAARLCTSLCFSSHGQKQDPSNQYITLHQDPVKKLLDKLIAINPIQFELHLMKACELDTVRDLKETRTGRSKHLSKSLSVSYHEPIDLTRGALQYLYNSDGHTFLDGVNNISHVGHCHPEIVKAATNQMARLNTNTRYLYHQLNTYAEAICNLLPDTLSTVFFVNSGTEANELALRLARNHTGHQDIIVIDAAYHGNSTATLEISPYKYKGPGGSGKKAYIHEFQVPDLYRGKFRADDENAVSKYLNEQEQIIAKAVASSSGIAGFIGESLLGCGGQIELPKGYLQGTYRQIRKQGGVCIADEVQVGFGRVGSHYWGFETQGVIPDIVTMGKPMGNGHPLAAVATTKEIAASFENGMEYFNSFGGNPVSCAIGLTVVQIIEEEELQKNALEVGGYLKSRLKQLQRKHPPVGDVRGLGLFLGVELVKDPINKKPDPELAHQVVESMKNQGILLSTDGPAHNVIKIKPPMVFSKDNASLLVTHFDQLLTDLTNV